MVSVKEVEERVLTSLHEDIYAMWRILREYLCCVSMSLIEVGLTSFLKK
jgi:hypothetical protein